MAGSVLAVTGDVGAGKSTVSRLLAENLRGGVLFSTDAAAWDLWNRKDIIEAAIDRWGRDILDENGYVIRGEVASRIFNNLEDYRWCCGLLHPLVLDEIEKRIKGLGPNRHAVVEVPLFFEAQRRDWVTWVVFVTAPRELRIERRREQRGWDEAELARREKFFMPSEERIKLSDFVIDNSAGPDALKKSVLKIVEKIQSQIRN